MDKPHSSIRKLVYPFSYGHTADTERYISTWRDLYIDQTTGKLISRYFVNTDPFSLRQGSVSASDGPITYAQLKALLTAENIKDAAKFESLNEQNWDVWLAANGYV